MLAMTRKPMNSHTLRALAALAAAVSLAVPAAARTQVDRGMNLFSTEQDVEMGREAAAEAEKQLPILDDRELTAYVNDIGLRVAKASIEPRYPYQFRIVDAAEINAFALPGGFIYVNRGVLATAQDEAELAGVLAHEVGHVAARHGTSQLSKQVMVQMPLTLLMGSVAKDDGGWKSTLGKLGLNLGLNAVFLSYSRKAETQADVLATQELWDAGYDPQGTARFFERMEKVARHEPSRLESFFASHPSPGDRRTRVAEEVRQLGAPSGPVTTRTREFERMKARLDRLPPPREKGGARPQPARDDDRASGYPGDGRAPRDDDRWPRTGDGRDGRDGGAGGAGNVYGGPHAPAPSSRFRRYRDPGGDFRILIPADWETYVDRGEDSVTFGPSEGRDAQGQLTHGAILRFVRLDASSASGYGGGDRSLRPGGYGRRGSELERALDRLVDELVDGNPYLRETRGARRRVTVDGEAALATELEGWTAYGRRGYRERVQVVVRPLADGGRAVALVMVAPDRDWDEFRPAFEDVAANLRLLRG